MDLGIRSTSDQTYFFGEDIGYQPPPPTNVIDYFEGIVASMVESGQQRYEKKRDADRTYFMLLPHAINSMNFNIDDAMKKEMFKIGYDGMGVFIESKQ